MNAAIEYLEEQIVVETEFLEGEGFSGGDIAFEGMMPALLALKDRLEDGVIPTVEEFRTWSWELYDLTTGPAGYGDDDTTSEITDTLAEMLFGAEDREKFYETYYEKA